jgi:hypothetical protein
MVLTQHINIKASAHEVWCLINNIQRKKEWIPCLQQSSRICGIPGKRGYVTRSLYQVNGYKFELQEEVIDRKPFLTLRKKILAKGIKGELELHLAEIGHTTTIAIHLQVEWLSFRSQLLKIIWQPIMERKVNAALENLKEALEELPAYNIISNTPNQRSA